MIVKSDTRIKLEAGGKIIESCSDVEPCSDVESKSE